MASPLNSAVQKVVDAWLIPGIDPAEHYAWQKKLAEPSPDGWPMLERALQELVAVWEERKSNKAPR